MVRAAHRRCGAALLLSGAVLLWSPPVATAAAWAEGHLLEQQGGDVSAVAAARREWVTDPYNSWGIEGEDADPYHRRAFGDDAPKTGMTAGA